MSLCRFYGSFYSACLFQREGRHVIVGSICADFFRRNNVDKSLIVCQVSFIMSSNVPWHKTV